MDKNIGHYSFIGGVILAIILGIVSGSGSNVLGSATAWLVSLLIVLGLIVGLMNIKGKETKEFLMIATILIITAFVGNASDILSQVEIIGGYLAGIFSHMLAFVVPATIVVALKQVWNIGQNQ